jgi:hypothetical protein
VKRIKMPATVPMPSARELDCTGEYTNGAGQCCMLGWALVASGEKPATINKPSPLYQVFVRALVEAIDEDPTQVDFTDACDIAQVVGEWNDEHTPEQRAKAYRKAMRSLGYTEVA